MKTSKFLRLGGCVMGLVLLFGGLASPVQAGGIIIDGTDSNDHGSFNGSVNVGGWLYMQRALDSLASQTGPSISKTLVVLGTDPSTMARSAIDSAFIHSTLPGSGWSISYVNGAANITTALTNLSTTTTGILYIPTYNNSVGDLAADEIAAINAKATQINTFVTNGGSLWAMAESGVGEWGWLTTLLPGLTPVDDGTGGNGDTLSLTANGNTAFPGLTNADLSTGPWHNHFTGNLGGLQVMADETNGNHFHVILGGSTASGVVSLVETPEPASITLMALGALAASGYGMKRRKMMQTA